MAPSIGADAGIRRLAGLGTVTLVVAVDQFAKELAPHVHAAAVAPAHNPGFVTGWAPVSSRVVALLSALVVVAFARRVWQLHNDACTITLQLPSLRAVVVGR